MTKKDEQESVGLVVACHCGMAREMVKAAELILGSLPAVRAVTMEPRMNLEEMTRSLQAAVDEVDQGHGVLILTDLFGGTPCNVALALSGTRAEVVSGVNLPMLIKFAQCRSCLDLHEIARQVCEYGRRHMSVAGEILS